MLAIDHIVLAAVDPKQAAEEFAKKHHVKVIEGGRHENWGTYNYLAYFSNESYIEWIGIFDEELAKQSTNPLITKLVDRFSNNEEGFYEFALRTKNMDKYIEHLKKKELPFTGPFSGSRQRPDGSLLEWSMLFPDQSPFIVQWGETKNLPEDPHFINKQKLDIVQANLDENKFSDIFNIEIDDQSVQLTNGSLHFSDDNGFDFKMS